MEYFGNGRPLKVVNPYLRDDVERWARILDVAERNSVIEGLPPFDKETRERIMNQLAAVFSPPQEPDESPPSSGHSPS